MEQLQNLKTWHESEIYLNSLKNVYNWRENSEVVKYFYGLVKKSFDIVYLIECQLSKLIGLCVCVCVCVNKKLYILHEIEKSYL